MEQELGVDSKCVHLSVNLRVCNTRSACGVHVAGHVWCGVVWCCCCCFVGWEGVRCRKGDIESANSALPTLTPQKLTILTQSFTLTFLAEWGDRSQIATIALASAKDPIGVTLGGILGHAMCTGLAVLGGRLLATKISERTVSIAGGLLFLVFAVHSVYAGPDV